MIFMKDKILNLQNIDLNLITYGKKAGVEENVKLRVTTEKYYKYYGYKCIKKE